MTKAQWDNGTPIKLADCKPGIKLVVGEGFTCLPDWAQRTIFVAEDGAPYIWCGKSKNKHYLDGQLGHNGNLVGLRRAP